MPLADVLSELRAVQSAIAVFAASALRAQLPILDDSQDARTDEKEPILGLAHFKDRVESEIKFIAKFVNSSKPPLNEPNTNAPNLIAVFNEIIAAPEPVLAIGKTYNVGQTAVKVDVVADDGRQWIRVNTVKNSRLLAEFREQDSYLTDSDEDDQAEPTARSLPLQNSVITMCGQLLEAANSSDLHGIPTSPTVVLRLTRLDGTLGDDPRIARTIETIRAMPGLVLEQGQRQPLGALEDDSPSQATAPATLLPTDHINLDLSVLVALVSDSTHAPLPLSQKDGRARFRSSRRTRGGSNGRSASSTPPNDPPSETHVNALVTQVLQESHRSIVESIASRVTDRTKFYATAHARDRCLRIVERIGGPGERRRAQALLVDGDSAAFWSDSRHISAAYSLPPLTPLHLLSDDAPEGSAAASPPDFFDQAVQTCERIFARSSEVGVGSSATASDVAQKTGVGKLTVHTVQSFAAGSRARMTTLTANKTSVRAFVREMRAAGHVPATSTDRAQADIVPAGVWIVDPRSLSESMRVDAPEAGQKS
ncbi:hypothetical protein AURDEDRAFT_181565 [Auricularia subglabra TFB-10046 SS5]|nr:hypothetical protein AURDEDRAFT_181565 [Auricularia subglabra TFB-10046 SS5]